MEMMKRIKYYTLDEILQYFGVNKIPHDGHSYLMQILSDERLKLNLVGLNELSTIITLDQVETFIDALANNIYDRHNEDYIARIKHDYLEKEDENEDLEKAAYKGLNKLISVIDLTAPKYIPILVSYYKNYEEPLKKLESEFDSFSRFNDTPQNVQDILNFNSEEYATNMGRNKNLSKVDGDTIVNLIKNLQDNWRSIILEWSNEFNQIFINEMQLGELL